MLARYVFHYTLSQRTLPRLGGADHDSFVVLQAKHTKKIEIPQTKAMKKAKKHMDVLDSGDEDA